MILTVTYWDEEKTHVLTRKVEFTSMDQVYLGKEAIQFFDVKTQSVSLTINSDALISITR